MGLIHAGYYNSLLRVFVWLILNLTSFNVECIGSIQILYSPYQHCKLHLLKTLVLHCIKYLFINELGLSNV